MITCKGCGKDVGPLEVFPGDLDVECYAKTQEGLPLPTAQDIVRMWGG